MGAFGVQGLRGNSDMNPPVLLAVFAHPDDESFRCGGTLALLARCGMRVHVLTATRGQAGSRGDPPLCLPEELGAVREQELRCACAALGINSPRLLHYHDSTLSTVNEDEAAGQLVAAVRELRPQVLLTWPPHGLSGHPDHVAVSRWTALAFERMPASGLDGPVALYHLAVPRSVARALGLANLHAVPDEEIALAVDVTAVWQQKVAAIRCHHTQASSSPILSMSEGQQRLFLGREHFQRAPARMEEDPFMTIISSQKGDER
jgi:LmbE family N-acetylglucosaminyl deacetylase